MLHFCLFSYNRGRFLQNCLASIEHCAPQCPVTIFDDHSSDEFTQQVLQEARARHQVVQPERAEDGSSKFGGLYYNMARAVELAPAGTLLCFIQDDMQCARPIDDEDLADIHHFFTENTQAAFLHPAFLRGGKRMRDQQSMRYDPAARVYYRDNPRQSAGVNFSAIVIIHVDRLRAAGWQFDSREKLNDQKAARLFGRMGIMANPFCLWLPNVPVYRGKRKTLALRITEKMRRSGFYPVRIMNAEANSAFKQRDKTRLPVAEDFLTLVEGRLRTPWIYYSLEGLALFKQLNRLEVWLAKKLRRF